MNCHKMKGSIYSLQTCFLQYFENQILSRFGNIHYVKPNFIPFRE